MTIYQALILIGIYLFLGIGVAITRSILFKKLTIRDLAYSLIFTPPLVPVLIVILIMDKISNLDDKKDIFGRK